MDFPSPFPCLCLAALKATGDEAENRRKEDSTRVLRAGVRLSHVAQRGSSVITSQRSKHTRDFVPCPSASTPLATVKLDSPVNSA